MLLGIVIDHLRKILLYIEQYIIRTFILCTEHIAHDRVKCHLLLSGSTLHTTAESVCHKLGVRLFCVLCVEESRVDIGTSVIESREEETGIRGTYYPVSDTRSDALFFFQISESRLGQGNRADGAEHIFEYFL